METFRPEIFHARLLYLHVEYEQNHEKALNGQKNSLDLILWSTSSQPPLKKLALSYKVTETRILKMGERT